MLGRGRYADVITIGWLYLFIRMFCCLIMMSLGNYLPIQNYTKVVPVLPFSLVERSGVSEDHGELLIFSLDEERQGPTTKFRLYIVQLWLSTLLMVFGATMTLGARKKSSPS